MLLPMLASLLDSTYEDSSLVAIEAISQLSLIFGPLIKSTRAVAKDMLGGESCAAITVMFVLLCTAASHTQSPSPLLMLFSQTRFYVPASRFTLSGPKRRSTTAAMPSSVRVFRRPNPEAEEARRDGRPIVPNGQ